MLHLAVVTDDHASSILEPSVQALDFPAPLVAAERTTILRLGLASIRPMRSNEFDALRSEALVQSIAVVRLVANQPLRESRCETTLNRPFNKGDFMR